MYMTQKLTHVDAASLEIAVLDGALALFKQALKPNISDKWMYYADVCNF